MADIVTLSPDDVRILQQFLDAQRRQVVNPRNRPHFENESQSPETYIALTPETDIPGINGTVISYGRCNVYRILFGTTEDTLVQVDPAVDVYNLDSQALQSSTWVIVTRDKFGTWVAVGGTPSSSIRFTAKGKLDGILYPGGRATMSVWRWNQVATGTATSDVEESDTGENIYVYDWLLSSGQTIAAGMKVVATLIDGRMYVTGAQCP